MLIKTVVTFAQNNSGVIVWQDTIVIPTYKLKPPEKSPMFFRNQSYQGASKVIYPYPAQDNLTNKKVDKSYKALFLENDYLKVCILPEIGGRVFYATDKTNNYEIFYRQSVIKPALIGMTGAWISGGIEFCVYHHHRASTFLPVDYRLTQNEDGSCTIWIGEYEPRHRMKWTLGVSLYPGRSYLEVAGTLMNTTENVNSFLYWANVATHANDDYQIIFPPSVDFATFHAKNSFSHWPVTVETYRGRDYYRDSIDASWWKNHPEPVSFFAHDIEEGFLAGYDHGKDAGTVHVGNPHIVTGAKLWEWGPGDRGSMWDSKVLTDKDGSYAELMTGAYSDNQPDYSWIKPYETKTFHQYWYPLREIRGCKNANLKASINLELKRNGELFFAANTTQQYKNAKIVLKYKKDTIYQKSISIGPADPFHEKLKKTIVKKEQELELILIDDHNKQLISYNPVEKEECKSLPEPVTPPEPPEDIETVEELYLTGLRINQFHNARIDPVDYFREGLSRDPMDIRCNNQMGLYYKNEGAYDSAKYYLRKAVSRLTKNYTRPRNCEPLYHLGCILQHQQKYESAFDTLYRSAWDYEFRAASYYKLAQIAMIRGETENALDLVESSLLVNNLNLRALNLKVSILRHLSRLKEAVDLAHKITDIDKLNFQVLYEMLMIDKLEANYENVEKLKRQLIDLMRDNPENYLELAAVYINTGMYEEANMLLEIAVKAGPTGLSDYPTIHYYLGYIDHNLNNKQEAIKHFKRAGELPVDYCFPFRMETLKAYETALSYFPDDGKAFYYQGNILFDNQPVKAITKWEQAVRIDPGFAMAWRNIGWGYNYYYEDIDNAIKAYENAIESEKNEAKFYYELDKLYEEKGVDINIRLDLLKENHEQVANREDALIREIIVLVHAGLYEKAIQYLDEYFFHSQEGLRQLHDIHVDAHLLNGLKYLRNGDYQKALNNFKAANTYPDNHQLGLDPYYERNAQIYYYTGLGYEKDGNDLKAYDYYEKVISIQKVPVEYKYYVARAYEKTGEEDKAYEIYYALIEEGKSRLNREDEIEFFAKFGEGMRKKQQKALAYQLQGLGYMGMNKNKKAQELFKKALSVNNYQIWCEEYIKALKFFE